MSALTKFGHRMVDVAVGEPLQDFVMWIIVLNTLFMMCESHVNLFHTTHSDIYTACLTAPRKRRTVLLIAMVQTRDYSRHPVLRNRL